MRHVVYVHAMHFATSSNVNTEGIGLNAWDAIALRTLCMGEVGDGLWSEGKCGFKYETSCVDSEQVRELRVIP